MTLAVSAFKFAVSVSASIDIENHKHITCKPVQFALKVGDSALVYIIVVSLHK